MRRFRDEVADRHATDKIHLLFNNAGIGGGGSMIAHSRDEWEKTFNICWGGVYHCTRAFLPMLQKADEGHIVNTSSVNGFWASVGPRIPHTAYSAAKFAVKGFTEALIADLKINAPHIKCSVVMPGHIGTSIASNSRKIQSGNLSDEMNARQIEQARARIASMGRDASKLADEDIQKLVAERERRFREDAPTTAAEAATIILDGVKADRWRILVGPDAQYHREMVRASPEQAYDTDFFEELRKEGRLAPPDVNGVGPLIRVRKFAGWVLAISTCSHRRRPVPTAAGVPTFVGMSESCSMRTSGLRKRGNPHRIRD